MAALKGKARFIEVAFSDESLDSYGFTVKNDVSEELGIGGIKSVQSTELYYLETYPEIGDERLAEMAEKVFTDPLVQKFSVNENIFPEFDFFIEVKFHEDVTDNAGIVALEGIEDFYGKKFSGRVRTAKRFYFRGNISARETERIAKELLANEVIETFSVVRGKGNGK